MSDSGFDVHSIARLARLELSPEEEQRLGRQFEQIMAYIGQLNTLNTSEVEPTAQVHPVQNVFREDRAAVRFPEEDFLSLAPACHKGHYEVPQIIG
ncbi:MAG: Asp-tRNA(Asn)/Glu-tRNA(Gln) amidotransferase subunit GatC [Nitrospina sp.]|nr:Asp-tRNA(Asn)/Glu-tRNA(Gln) amidotransferase subunit GatC [Nitrospina sp.]